ncbi:MAG TPA: hypothetical protein PL155_09160 [Candidatus Omnitrophota bacterium]|nr:hypothetical protein [Candidatus Omnitrophota bacterium]HPD85655.1 hypothetical protein [Candidatus Omnitrophota bacterium]HRZ04498.1 hypothetical protein [Candidatus Omnitrophota bacterium]
MADIFGLSLSLDLLFQLVLSISFFVGIILMVSPEGFEAFNRALQKEYGIKKRFMPKLEDAATHVIDKTIIKNRVIAGMCISVMAFLLLLLTKI